MIVMTSTELTKFMQERNIKDLNDNYYYYYNNIILPGVTSLWCCQYSCFAFRLRCMVLSILVLPFAIL